MSFFRKKQVVVEAITFDEFVEYGKKNGGNIVNGMPWNFNYKGIPATCENDSLYLLPRQDGTICLFTPTDVLVTGIEGTFVYNKEWFEDNYETA